MRVRIVAPNHKRWACPPIAIALVRQAYLEVLEQVQRDIRRELADWLPLRADATPYEKLRRLYGELADLVKPRQLAMLERATQSILESVQYDLKQVPGIDAGRLMSGGYHTLHLFKERNARLIKTIGSDQLDKVARVLSNPHVTELHREGTAKVLEQAFNVEPARAEFWAVDQTLKLHAQVNENRQVACGIVGYYWRDSGDEAVRPRHRFLAEQSDNGRIFLWSDPPIVSEPGKPIRKAHPGGDFRCRCIADPAIEGDSGEYEPAEDVE